MKEKWKNVSLSVKSSVMYTLMLLSIMGIFTLGLYVYFRRITVSSVTEAVNYAMDINSGSLENFLKRLEISIGSVHENDHIYAQDMGEISPIGDMIVSYERSSKVEDYQHLVRTYDENLYQFNNYFLSCFGEEGGDFSNIFFVDSAWPIHVFFQKRPSVYGNGFGNNEKVRLTDWYLQTENKNGDVWWFTLPHEPNRLCVAKRVIYRHNIGLDYKEDNLGVLIVSFDMSVFSERMDVSGLTPNSEMVLVDDSNRVIYSSNGRADICQDEFEETAAKLQPQEHQFEGRSCLLNARKLPLDLKLLTIVPTDDIYKTVSGTVNMVIIASLMLTVIGILITVVISRTIVIPLRRLTEHMEKGGMESAGSSRGSMDEVSILYKAYNHLMEELDSAMKNIQETDEKKRRAEQQALQAQMDPHFIYNTLNSISCLALLNGEEQISELIVDLTKIIRYKISWQDRLVTLAEEIVMIRQYENIQKSCLRQELDIEYRIAPPAETLLIPRLTIQPLVENALIHGRREKNEAIRIRISAHAENGEAIICVWDNGTAADTERINHYLRSGTPYEGESLGVRNVSERLIGIWPEAAVYFEKDSDGHTMAVIRIPTGRKDSFSLPYQSGGSYADHQGSGDRC